MQLCDLDLYSYIDSVIKSTWSEKIQKKLPYFACAMPPRLRHAQIWDIMDDVTNGLSFVHTNKEVHHDLKLHNSALELGDNADGSSVLPC